MSDKETTRRYRVNEDINMGTQGIITQGTILLRSNEGFQKEEDQTETIFQLDPYTIDSMLMQFVSATVAAA